MKLVLKVKKTQKHNDKFFFNCEDQLGVSYFFLSKCYKKEDSYILVTVKNYTELIFDQYKLEVLYLEDLKVLNNKLVDKNNKGIKGDYIKEVFDRYIGKAENVETDIKYYKEEIKGLQYIDSYTQEQQQREGLERLRNKIKRAIKYYNLNLCML